MTPEEKFKLKKMVVNDLKSNEGYIKGHGPKLCRVMDKNHNPLYNIDKEVINSLVSNNTLKVDGLIYKLNLENQ